MDKRLVLHIGPPKTATTTLQQALTRSAAQLLELGVFYPATVPPSEEGHHSLAWEIQNETAERVLPVSRATLGWSAALDQFRASPAHTLLLSSENFANFSVTDLARLSEITAEFPLTVVLALRDPLRVVRSAWKHSVRWGFGAGEELLAFDAAVPMMVQFARIDVASLVEMIEKHLRPARIGLFVLAERMAPPELFRRFTEAAGLPPAAAERLAAVELTRTNEALSDWKVAHLLTLNQEQARIDPESMIYPRNSTSDRLWMRETILKALDAIEDRPDYRLPIGSEAVGTLAALRTRLLACVSSRPVAGSLGELARAPPDRPPEAPEEPPIDLSGLLLAAFARAATDFTGTWSYLQEVIEAREGWKGRADRAEAKLAEAAVHVPGRDPAGQT